jgi:hypothetical protein
MVATERSASGDYKQRDGSGATGQVWLVFRKVSFIRKGVHISNIS